MGEYAPTPLAYHITFTTYGTRLHGDARGTVDRFRNQPRSAVIPGCTDRHRCEVESLRFPVFTMDDAQRSVVHGTIEEVCSYRHWRLHAVNVRTNHVHVVVSAPTPPEAVMSSLKAWATRRLREAGLVASERRIWTDHGSTGCLWKTEQVTSACRYVVEGQGDCIDGARG